MHDNGYTRAEPQNSCVCLVLAMLMWMIDAAITFAVIVFVE